MTLLPSLAAPLRRGHLPGLDALRALAVGIVMLYHFGYPSMRGGYGVLIFFVLSGFLITWLMLAEEAATGTISLRGFYRRRMLRIFPAAYVYWFVLVAALLITHRPVLWPHAWSAFFYVSNYYNALYGDPNNGFSHTWSLGIEEQFYLLWPFVFLWVQRRRWPLHKVLAWAVALICAYRAVLALGLNIDQAYIYAAFDTRADALLAGCLLAVLLHQERLPRLWSALTASSWMPVVTLAVGVAIAIGDHLNVSRWRDVIAFSLLPWVTVALIVQVIALSDRPSLRWLEHPIVRYLGRISYPLYLWQQLTLAPVRKLLHGAPEVAQLIGAFGLTIAIASLSYRFVEKPFLRLKRPPLRSPLPLAASVTT